METNKFEITHKSYYNHNVQKIVLSAPNPIEEMKISSFIQIYNEAGECKPYTPICANEREIVLAIKIYQNGRVSEWLSKKNVGDKVKVTYFLPKREFVKNEHKNVLMIAGGTGITPMYQILRESFRHEDNFTRYTLLFLNKSKEDIFMKEEIEELKTLGKDNFKIINFITREKKSEGKGFTIDDLKNISDKEMFDFIYVCGPPSLLEDVSGKKTKDKQQGELSGMLKSLGYSSEQVYKF